MSVADWNKVLATMPLKKCVSNKIRRENIRAEIAAGKPPKQASGDRLQRAATGKKETEAEMTESTIRNMAKRFAGAWYEQSSRSERFRRGEDQVTAYTVVQTDQGPREIKGKVPFRVAFPNVDTYVKAAWPFWVEYARSKMAEMLGPHSMATDRLKNGFYAALLEENERALKHGSSRLLQGKLDDGAIITDPYELR